MKVFKDEQWFDFKNITILTGTNNSGKSSIINAMQMLQENLKGRTIDDLIRTKFILPANQNKYGSIENFINYENRTKTNDFEFFRRIGNIEYRITIKISEGIENYGSVKKICATDLKDNIRIFSLEIKNPYPKYQSIFNINYKYFVDRFYEKCYNTEKLFLRIKELDILLAKVNDGIVSAQELYDFAYSIGKEVSVYINVIPVDFNNDQPIEYAYFIDEEKFSNAWFGKEFDELKVFFDPEKRDGSNSHDFISQNKYKELYESAFKQGIFDFSFLWDNNSEVKSEFSKIVCTFYKNDFVQSSKLLCDDLMTLLSNYYWEMNKRYYQDDKLINQVQFLTKTYIECLPDFGLIASNITFTHNDDNEKSVTSNLIANWQIIAKSELKSGPNSLEKLRDSNFDEKALTKIINLIVERIKKDRIDHKHYVENKQHNNSKDILFDYNRLENSVVIQSPVYQRIYADIENMILNINLTLKNEFVSSSRFTLKRYYNFTDNTDFTNFLKKAEDSNYNNVKECREFINLWLNEFGIANELILKPDSETGNFKAYLRINGNINVLADFGLGTNQLLPIIFALGIHRYHATKEDDELVHRTVVIEEPEANLHPALQSKLADMFVDATKKFGVQIIVETHSEYLIRKMQYLVASKQSEAKPEDVVMYYFYKPDHSAVISGEVKQVERIDIDESGILSKDFGNGFFDEALHWKFELLKLKNMN